MTATNRNRPEDAEALRNLVEAQLDAPVSRQMAAIGDGVRIAAAGLAGGDPDAVVAAVLGYGSCLRDVSPADGLADFYVLTSEDARVGANPFSRLGCRLVPPNVYYAECDHEGLTLRAKYAVLSLSRFEKGVSERSFDPYFWARFAQPSALIWASEEHRERILNAIESAVVTMLRNVLALADRETDHEGLWIAGLRATYGTELRPESAERAKQIVSANRRWYAAAAHAVLGEDVAAALAGSSDAERAKARSEWRRRRRLGKTLSALRLIKAAFTFRGGADYLAWKIERHSGIPVKLSDWQRRHPILAAVWLMPKLYLRDAFK